MCCTASRSRHTGYAQLLYIRQGDIKALLSALRPDLQEQTSTRPAALMAVVFLDTADPSKEMHFDAALCLG